MGRFVGRRAVVAMAALLTAGVTVTAAGAAAAPRALVTVVASTTYTNLYSLTSDPSGRVYGVDNNTGAVLRFGGVFADPKVVGTDTHGPDGITYHDGLLYLSNSDGSITTIPAAGGASSTVVATPSVAGSEASSQNFSWDAQSNLYVANYTGNVIAEVAPGASTETTTGLRLPTGCGPFGTLIVGKALYVSCYSKNDVVKATLPLTTGEVPKVVATPKLGEPGELVLDAHHNMYLVNDEGHTVVRVPLAGGRATYVATYGTTLDGPWGLAIVGSSLYTVVSGADPNVLAKIALPAAR